MDYVCPSGVLLHYFLNCVPKKAFVINVVTGVVVQIFVMNILYVMAVMTTDME